MIHDPSIYPEDAWTLLSPNLTAARRAKMQDVAAKRTKKIRLVIQDTHHPHNVSACLRSAEAFGLLNIDIVNLKEKFKPSTVTRGVQNWLNTRIYSSVEACVAQLRAEGYLIAAGYPRPDATPLSEVPVNQPIAIVFGNEHAGVHESWRPHIDFAFSIPMVGFVESLNISVSCAISLYDLSQRAQNFHGTNYRLNQAEIGKTLNAWVCRDLPQYDLQLQRIRAQAQLPTL